MTWIREDELKEEKVLDEVEVWDMLYVKVADKNSNMVKNNLSAKTERRTNHGLHTGINLWKFLHFAKDRLGFSNSDDSGNQ